MNVIYIAHCFTSEIESVEPREDGRRNDIHITYINGCRQRIFFSVYIYIFLAYTLNTVCWDTQNNNGRDKNFGKTHDMTIESIFNKMKLLYGQYYLNKTHDIIGHKKKQ